MKLKDLKAILYSSRGNVQLATLYDGDTDTDIESGTIDYIVANYGEKEVFHIEAFENQLIITV